MVRNTERFFAKVVYKCGHSGVHEVWESLMSIVCVVDCFVVEGLFGVIEPLGY